MDKASDHTFDEYVESLDFSLAVEKALINIGIDAWQIREHDAELYDDMPALQQAIALRNRLAHGYGELINDEVIWRTITVYIPELLNEVNDKLTKL